MEEPPDQVHSHLPTHPPSSTPALRPEPIRYYVAEEVSSVSRTRRAVLSLLWWAVTLLTEYYFGLSRVFVTVLWGIGFASLIWLLWPDTAWRTRTAAILALFFLTVLAAGIEVGRISGMEERNERERPYVLAIGAHGSSPPDEESKVVTITTELHNTGSRSALRMATRSAYALSQQLDKVTLGPITTSRNPFPPSDGSKKTLTLGSVTVSCSNPDKNKCDKILYVYLSVSYGADGVEEPYHEEFWYVHELGTDKLTDASLEQAEMFEPHVRRALSEASTANER